MTSHENKDLSFWVKNDLLMVLEHLARDHKRFGIALTT